jgi:phosphoglycolate phosphatase-like HAD superfamily hydrolase
MNQFPNLQSPIFTLPDTAIEIIKADAPRAAIKAALFDFDGTISLIREGWQQVMIPMMVEFLQNMPAAEDEAALTGVVTKFVTRLTGKQTVYQMIQLAEEIKQRGGQPKDPLEYKRIYLDRLWQRIENRVAGLKNNRLNPLEMVVPGSIDALAALREQGVTCYLASGTDEPYVLDEAQALGVAQYFNGGIYGARDDYKSFSKKMIIARVLHDNHLTGAGLVTFGDGFVEIENTVEVGGLAVGVASDEAARQGIDAWKRQRLIEAGAAIIIPDFSEHPALLRYLNSQ